MITTQNSLDLLAARIERAYRLRHPSWLPTGLTPGVWVAAAKRLLDVEHASSIPIDPELFVAVQDFKAFRRDPWRELTQERATRSYKVAVRGLVRQLKVELAGELRWSRRFFDAGHSLDDLLALTKSRVSPMMKLVLCLEQRRPDLACVVRPAAEAQHLSCPLYQIASRRWLSGQAYPVPAEEPPIDLGVPDERATFAWN